MEAFLEGAWERHLSTPWKGPAGLFPLLRAAPSPLPPHYSFLFLCVNPQTSEGVINHVLCPIVCGDASPTSY